MGLTNTENSSNHQSNQITQSHLFLGENRYRTGSYINDGYDTITLAKGTLLGRVAATGLLVPLFSDNNDGSQYPVGVLAQAVTVTVGQTVNLTFCHKGDVDQDGLVLDVGDADLNVVVAAKTLADWIHDLGIKLISGDQLTDFDNA